MNIDNIMKHSNATPFFTKTSAGIVCSYCVKALNTIEELRTHIHDSHKNKMVTNFRKVKSVRLCFKVDITDLKCKICNENFNIISSLKAHLIKDHHIKFYHDVKDYFCEFKLTSDKVNSCALCDKTFNSFLTLLHHMNSHYSNYICRVCKVGFINIQAWKPHERRCLAKTEMNIIESRKLQQPPRSDCTRKQFYKGSLNFRQASKWEYTKIKYNVENILNYSNCTPFINQTVAGIVCAFCDSCLDDLQSMRTHVTEVHYKEDNFIEKYKRLTEIDSLVVKIDITDLVCTICNTNIDFISNLKEHVTKEHNIVFFTDVKDYFVEFKLTSTGIFTCVFCNSNHETFKMMIQHLTTKHYNNYVCEICGVSFINKHSQAKHKSYIHDTNSYKCSTCNKVFSNKEAQSNHEKGVHQKEARFKSKCPFCDAIFTDYTQRNRHFINEHNTRAANYNCKVCERTFVRKVELTRHIRKMHLLEKNQVCSYCGKRFFDTKGLKKHLAVHETNKIR